jgi:hypothetical protein
MFYLMPQFPSIRFTTILPTGPFKQITARITRTGGTNRRIWVDIPIVEIDVWGFSNKSMDASIAAREIQASLLGLAGLQVTNGVIQHVITINGPRRLAEVNPALARYNASYEVRLHP